VNSFSKAIELGRRTYFVTVGLPARRRGVRRYREESLSGADTESWERYWMTISALARRTRASGASFLAGVIPMYPSSELNRSYSDWLEERLQSGFRDEGIDHVVLDDSVGLSGAHTFPRDRHWSASGHRLAAAALDRALRAAAARRSLPSDDDRPGEPAVHDSR